MKTVQVIFLTLLSVLTVSAQIFARGRCPHPAVQENFDLSRPLGKWYEIQRLPNILQKGECSTSILSLKSPGVIDILNRELLANGTINTMTGLFKVKDPSEPAKLEASLENYPPGPYWVLSTDYDGHSLGFGCTDFFFGVFHAEYAYILSREPTLPQETLKELHRILTSAGVDVDFLTNTNQDEAFCSAMNQ
ncbi:apolipoprotein D-like [Diretmus argenteus]